MTDKELSWTVQTTFLYCGDSAQATLRVCHQVERFWGFGETLPWKSCGGQSAVRKSSLESLTGLEFQLGSFVDGGVRKLSFEAHLEHYSATCVQVGVCSYLT